MDVSSRGSTLPSSPSSPESYDYAPTTQWRWPHPQFDASLCELVTCRSQLHGWHECVLMSCDIHTCWLPTEQKQKVYLETIETTTMCPHRPPTSGTCREPRKLCFGVLPRGDNAVHSGLAQHSFAHNSTQHEPTQRTTVHIVAAKWTAKQRSRWL